MNDGVIEIEETPFENCSKYKGFINWGSKRIPVIVEKHINGETKYIADVHDPEDSSVLADDVRVQWAEAVEMYAKRKGVGNPRKTD